ncbi:hypothetical protein BDZ97DRAFT_1853016 [Flammula alnicola]|nr:hypothetical protein BDZ97DRAFT_1853016 [Flammula alnicola]
MPASSLSELTTARYGKTKVRVFRIVREGKWHHIVEYNVEALLEGEIGTSYTEADNSVVVATDSIKNITYYLAKISPHILNAEKFALHLGTFLVSKYAHIRKAFVTVEQLRWTRIHVDGTAGKDKLVGKVTSGISDLLVLKSTGSAFENFYHDEFTTLIPVDDRIFSTSIDLSYTFADVQLKAPTDEKKLSEEGYAGSVWDEEVPTRARAATLETFALDESASVQATLYKMAERVIAENVFVNCVTYALPNKHYVPVDMKYIGIDNTTPAKADVFMPIAHPRYVCLSIVSDLFE